MQKERFGEKIKEEFLKKMKEEVTVNIQKVKKNNNVTYLGMLIQQGNSNISSTIYLDSFYESYEQGENIDNIVDKILQVYRRGKVKAPINMDFFQDFESVKDRIAYKLINAKSNRELLEQIPHIEFLDLAICFYYAFSHDELGDGSILIHNSHMKMWRTNHQELLKLAEENTPKLFPYLIVSMDMIIQNFESFNEAMMSPLFVLTNRARWQGAICLLYENVLQNMAEKLGGNFYVLPSSVHEVILLKDTGNEDVKALREMILEVNGTQLLPEEILSEYPYYYNQSEKKLSQVKVN